MRFLANENFPLRSVHVLRADQHDVLTILEGLAGAADDEVLARAVREDRIILTFDRDYGELVFRRGLPTPPGVVYFRFNPATPDEPARLLRQVLADQIELIGQFTVLDLRRVRQRPMPRR